MERSFLHPRDEILEAMERIYRYRMTTTSGGNLSIREPNGDVWITPARVDKGGLRREDIVCVRADGTVEGARTPSSELPLHQAIYRARPDVRGIVHAHPRTATGFAAAGIPLNEPLVCEVVIGLGSIPLAKYGTPGTPELADALEPLIPQYDAILMSNHGVVAYGADLHQAYMKMETVEHFAQIALITHLLGCQQPLQGLELEKLIAVRSKYQGSKSAAPMPLAVPNGNGDDCHNGRLGRTSESEPDDASKRRRVLARQR